MLPKWIVVEHQELKLCIQNSNMIMLCLVLAAFLNMLQVRGATHIVGDRDGWSLFADSNNWTQGKEFLVGDVLVFNYEEHVHSVMQVNSTAYEDCIKDPYISLFASGSDSVVLSEVGRSWYICGVGDHSMSLCKELAAFARFIFP